MRNTKQANLEFAITFAETNLRYFYGAEVPNMELIQTQEQTLKELKEKLAHLIQHKTI